MARLATHLVMDALAAAPVDAAEIRQEPKALREGRARAAVQVVREPIVPGRYVRPIAPEQLVQIGHHLLKGRQRTFDLRRLDDRRRDPPGELGMRVKPGDAGSLAEVVGEALERIHPGGSLSGLPSRHGKGTRPRPARARRNRAGL